MRITVLCNDLGIRLPGSKGASVHLASITRAFARLGHEVQLVAVAGHEPLEADLADRLADVVLFSHPGRAEGLERERRKLAHVERAVAEAGPRIEAFAPELIYERLALFSDAGARLSGRLGVPLAVEVNAVLSREEAAWRGLHLGELARRREREILGAAAVRVAVSAEAAAVVDEVAPGGRTVVVPNGVETERFAHLPERAAARRHFALPDAVPVAVFVGALRPWHGVEVAIEAVAASRTGAHLLVVGDGEIAPDLADLAHQRGVTDRVHFAGQRPHGEVALALAAADVAVAPYPALEGFAFSPLKLYEYLAAGVPVIASAVGQVNEALGHGRFGTLVAPGDPAALAAALDQPVGEDRSARAAAGRAHALDHHDWTARAAQILDAVGSDHALAR